MKTPLRFQNFYHRALPRIPFTYGVPIPAGVVRDVKAIGLLDARGASVPVSAQGMATWPDGSIRWALLDFAGDFAPSERANWTLVLGEPFSAPAPHDVVTVTAVGSGYRVANGRLELTVGTRPGFTWMDRLTADGVECIDSGNRCDVRAVSPAGKIFRASLDPAPRLTLEEITAQRVTVRWEGGLYAGDGERCTEFRIKMHIYAGNPYIKVEHTAINRELPERGVWFKEYTLEFDTALERRTEKVVRQKNHDTDYLSRLVALRQNVTLQALTEGQGRSYGDSPENPTGKFGTVGKVILEDEGAFQEEVGRFPHFLHPQAPRVMLGGGYAVVYPFLGVRDSRRTAVVSFLRMAAQHPKALRADENRIACEIWPSGAGTWRLCRGMSKTHHLAMSWVGRPLSDDEVDGEAVRRECFTGGALSLCPHDPVSVTLDPAYARMTGQVEAGEVLAFQPARYPRIEAKIAGITLHGDPLALAGIMDYGEKEMTNNEEDQGHEYALEYYRSGSYIHYCKLMAQMLHNSTVDVVDGDPDPLRQGGTPYHTTYHQDAVCVPSHTWTEGLFEYAYVSGDREAFRAAVGICDWILRFIDQKPHLVKQDGREIGWPIIALTAGYQATGDVRYRAGAFHLVDFYREKVAAWGRLANAEPPGTGYHLMGYGEYAGFEGMHKLWRVTRDEPLRRFAVEVIGDALLNRGHLQFTGHGRFMDLYALYAIQDMAPDPRWVEMARQALPFALTRKHWNGYFYRRLIHFLGWCDREGILEDALTTLDQ